MKLKELFELYQGNGLELLNMEQSLNSQINFVSRTSQNNGVIAFVNEIQTKPFESGLITVALGGSVMSAFVQTRPFYTAFHIMVLRPKKDLTLEQKIFYCTAIKSNAYRYSYGRQANKTLKDIEIPSIEECNKFIDNYRIVPIQTSINVKNAQKLDSSSWQEFRLCDFFNINAGKYYFSDEYNDGKTPYITAANTNNAIAKRIDLPPDFNSNVLTVGKVGATSYYQSEKFCATSDVNILSPLLNFNKYIGLFIATIINFSENYKWNYGRQARISDCIKMTIKLPAKSDKTPDWNFMENYIKSLPYADRI